MATPRGLIRQLRRVQADAYNDLQQQVWGSMRSVRRVIQDAATDVPNLTQMRAQQAVFREVARSWDALSVDLEGWFKDLTLKISPTFQDAAIERMMRPGRPVASTITRYSRERADRVFQMIHPANGDRIAGVFTDKMTEANLNALRNAVVEVNRAAAVEGWTSRRIHKEIQARWTATAQSMVPRVATHGFTDIAGRNWDNARYLNMLTRTTTARIARESYMQTLLDAGDDLMRIEAVGDTCPTCMAWDGLIVSMSGTNPKFPSYQDAIQAGWGHPNCDCLLTSVDETLDKQEVETQEEVENVDWFQREQVAKYRERARGEGKASEDESVQSVETRIKSKMGVQRIESEANPSQPKFGTPINEAERADLMRKVELEYDRLKREYPNLNVNTHTFYALDSDRGLASLNGPQPQMAVKYRGFTDTTWKNIEEWEKINGRRWGTERRGRQTEDNFRHELAHNLSTPQVLDEWHRTKTRYTKRWFAENVSEYAQSHKGRMLDAETLAETFGLFTREDYQKGTLPLDIERFMMKLLGQP